MRKLMLCTALCVLFALAVGFSPRPVQAAAFDPPPKMIATLNASGAGGFSVPLSAGVNPPAGLALCAGYNFQTFPSGPLPLHPFQTTIGCDQAFFPGQATTVDYDVSNAPDFNAFVTLITNGNDDTVFLAAESIDSNRMVAGPDGTVGETESANINFVHPKQQEGPDLAGFTIDFVRLDITQIQITNTIADGTLNSQAQWTAAWQFWGRKAHP